MGELWVGFVFDLAAEPLSQRCDVLTVGLPGAQQGPGAGAESTELLGGCARAAQLHSCSAGASPGTACHRETQLKTAPRSVEHLQRRPGTALSWSDSGQSLGKRLRFPETHSWLLTTFNLLLPGLLCATTSKSEDPEDKAFVDVLWKTTWFGLYRS